MTEFKTDVFLCRTTRAARLYRNVYDMSPVTAIIPGRVKFYTRKQSYTAGGVDMAYVSVGYDDSIRSCEHLWCPMDVLEIMPVMEEEVPPDRPNENDFTDVDVYLLIMSNNIVLYENFDSLTPVPHGLREGDKIHVDKEIDVQLTETRRETRYRLSDTTSPDKDIIGRWVPKNIYVKTTVGEVVTESPDFWIISDGGGDSSSTETASDESSTPGESSDEDTPAYQTSDSDEGGGNGDGTTDEDDIDTGDDDSNGEGDSSGETKSSLLDDLESPGYQPLVDSMYKAFAAEYGSERSEYDSATFTNQGLGRVLFINGLPFQWTYITDRRYGATGQWGYINEIYGEGEYPNIIDFDLYGRTFATDILGNLPIATIVPGTPKFLQSVAGTTKGGTKTTTGALLDYLTKKIEGDGANVDFAEADMMEALEGVNGTYDYYSMEIDNVDYFAYVNSMTNFSAVLMGLDNEYYGAKMLCSQFDWSKYNCQEGQDKGMFLSVSGLDGGVSFAYDPESSVEDSISNQTGQSQISGSFNNVSSTARELEFLVGYAGGIDSLDSSTYKDQATSALSENTGIIGGLKNAIDRISGWITNGLHGLNLRFPEIWQDSTFSKSYNIDMHFIAPYATPFCKWRYVIVPFLHIFAMAAPHADRNLTNYSSPFLIRAFSKGYFNVEMGIIETITWKRFGDGDMVSLDGIPTQIDVSISFKDLYQSLTITNTGAGGVLDAVVNGGKNTMVFMSNTGLMDLLGTISGVNMNRLGLVDRLEMVASGHVAAIKTAPGNFLRRIMDRFATWLHNHHIGELFHSEVNPKENSTGAVG